MKLRENLFTKLLASILFVLLLTASVSGGAFLASVHISDGYFHSHRVQYEMTMDAYAVREYYELQRAGQSEEESSQSRRLRMEELANQINLSGDGNLIWQLMDADGSLLLSNLPSGSSLVQLAGENPLKRLGLPVAAEDEQSGDTGEWTELQLVYSLRETVTYSDKYGALLTAYDRTRSVFVPVLIATIVAGLISAALFCFLVAAAGRGPGGEKAALNVFDRVWLEAPIAATVTLFIVWLSALLDGNAALIIVLSVLTACMLLVTVLTCIRRVKAKQLYATTLWHLLARFFRAAMKHIHLVARVVGVFLLYLVAQVVLVIAMISGAGWGGVAWFIWAMGNLSIIALLVLVAVQYNKIKKATEKMAEGNLGVVVDEKEVPFFRQIAHNLNSSGNAIKIAVEKSTHSERMKTELITNVSHDIKTPLTSIINYVDLLKTTGITDPKALEYVDILEHKSRRLAQLMADLVEASKVTSGAVAVNMESINLGELLKQAGGEFESRFEERGIQLMARLPEQPVLVYADGRHMWRVLDNLFGNAVKYALDGTRIYIDLADLGNEVVLSMKNISRDPLNIHPDELTERFVRGDQARVGEGSGLGLSIARSLMELQNGSMDIQIDGDLFKVILILHKL